MSGDLFTAFIVMLNCPPWNTAPLKGPAEGNIEVFMNEAPASAVKAVVAAVREALLFARGITYWRLWAQYQWHILLLLFRNRAVVVYTFFMTVTWKLHDVIGGTLLSLSFCIIIFLALRFVSRRFLSSPALFALVFINDFSLFTPIAFALNQHLLESFE